MQNYYTGSSWLQSSGLESNCKDLIFINVVFGDSDVMCAEQALRY